MSILQRVGVPAQGRGSQFWLSAFKELGSSSFRIAPSNFVPLFKV